MKFSGLAYRNLRTHRRYYRLAALAVVIATGVVTGSLLVGDSVRTTLVKRALERLGSTRTVILSRSSFIDESLTELISSTGNSRGVLLSDGFISSGGRLVPVAVWGTDDMQIARGTALVNPSLASEIGLEAGGEIGRERGRERGGGSDIVLRLPSGGLVPSGSLFVTENYTASLRLAFGGVVEADRGGNIGLRNEQTLPLNIFVDRAELAEALGVPGKINLVLSDDIVTRSDLERVWTPAHSGLSVRRREGFTEITSDRIFLQKEVVESIPAGSTPPDRLFSYLVNSISAKDRHIPYSFATAADSYGGRPLAPGEAIVSDYTARRLGAVVGDSLSLTWFTSGDLKTLSTDSISLKIGRIVPLSELAADTLLSADFPGLSDVERCTDWDSDLPLDMGLITDEDERYWELWRDTPKIIVSYSAVARSWGNDYGIATAVRIASPPDMSPSDMQPDLSGLTLQMFGMEIAHPREESLAAAREGVDFSSLFLALGCFIVASAMLLVTMPLSEMLHKRRREFETMAAMGFSPGRIVRMVWREAAPLVLLSAAAGTVAGVAYTGVVMWLLGNVWSGATHTAGFSVQAGALSLAGGFAAGVAATLLPVRSTIRRALKPETKPSRRRATSSPARKRLLAGVATASVVAAVVANLLWFDSVAFFVITGVLLIVAATLWGDCLVPAVSSPGTFDRKTLALLGIGASRSGAMRSLVVLSAGVFIVFSVGLNRKSFADPARIRTGTGGYTLWGESTVPLYHNLSTREGREALALGDLPPGVEVLQALRYGADDASCLNLNRVSAPTVLGIDFDALSRSDFALSETIVGSGAPGGPEAIDGGSPFEALASRTGPAVPALVDQTVLRWSLGRKLGDTLHYPDGRGGSVAIVLAGTLRSSLFQGNILIDRALFGEIWPELTGSGVFLAKSAPEETEDVRNLLSQALAEYGVRVRTASDRLREFNSVTDTYLSIFFTLGSLGLLLGIVSFIVGVRKNLARRGEEIRLFRAMGYSPDLTARLLYRENVAVPLWAIGTGVVGALLGAAGGVASAGLLVWLGAATVAALFALCTVWFVRRVCIKEVESAFL